TRGDDRTVRILYHHRTLKTDAQGIHVNELIGALRRQGHEVSEFSLVAGGNETLCQADRKGGRGVLRRASRGPARELLEVVYDAVATPRLRREVRRFRPDVIFERYSLYTAAGGRVARSAGIPFLIEVNAPLARERDETEGLSFPKFAQRRETTILNRADRVIAIST